MPFLTIAYVNLFGQIGFKTDKVLALSDFIKHYNVDIINCQEDNVDTDTFNVSDFICSNYDIIPNNAISKYGTCSLVSNNLSYNNVRFDTDRRAISFDLPDLYMNNGNIYLPSGNDSMTKQKREEYSSRILPNIFLDHLPNFMIGGD